MNTLKTLESLNLFRTLHSQTLARFAGRPKHAILDRSFSKALIVGAGNAGITVHAHLTKFTLLHRDEIRIVEPQAFSYFGPNVDLVPFDIKNKDEVEVPILKSIYEQTDIDFLRIKQFRPDKNKVITEENRELTYDNLILATGLVIDGNPIEGLIDALNDRGSGVVTSFNIDYAVIAKDIFEFMSPGRVLFYNAGAAAKDYNTTINTALLFESNLRVNKSRTHRDSFQLEYYTPETDLFVGPKSSEAIGDLFTKKNINFQCNAELIKIDKEKKEAVFRDRQTNEEFTKQYDVLFISPPCVQDPSVIKCKELVSSPYNLDINTKTLVHNKFSNVFALGHCTRVPAAYSQTALILQSIVLCRNLQLSLDALLSKKAPFFEYNGETSIPIFPDWHKCFTISLSEAKGETISPTSRLNYFNEVYKSQWIFYNLVVRGVWYGPTGLKRPPIELKD